MYLYPDFDMDYYHSKYKRVTKKRKGFLKKRIILTLIVLFVIAAITFGYLFYLFLYKANVWTHNETSESVYIPTGSDFEEVKTLLYEHGLIINRNAFELLAKKKRYNEHVKPGRYILYNGMSNLELINILNVGLQTPVKVVFNYIRTKEQLAAKVSEQIEADSASISDLLNDSAFLQQISMTPESAGMIFIPNTYEFYWNTDAKSFLNRMVTEYNKFWTKSRNEKAEKVGLSRKEVVILASIVDRETLKDMEKPAIAGVYINRLNKNWLLQADPTLIYATGDFNVRRVLNSHKEIESPYNTYKYPGLPPGPICIPSIASIDAVLNYDDHDYFYFCAKDDFSGYHTFAKTYRQHKKNAKKFQKALDARNIKK